MRILWISHFVPWPATGHGALQRSHHLLRQVARRHEVHLASLSRPDALRTSQIPEAAHQLRQLAASVQIEPLSSGARTSTRLVSLVSRTSYWEHWFWQPRLAVGIDALLRTHNFDLIHLDAVFLGRYLPGHSAVRFVLNHHNIESDLLTRRAKAERNPAMRALIGREAVKVARLERNLAGRAAINLVVSELDGRRLRALVDTALVADVPNGVDVDFFRPSGGSAVLPRSYIFAGGMDWFPNADAMRFLAEELWPVLALDEPSSSITIVGRHPPAELLRAAQSDGRIRVTGFVDDVRPYIEQAAIYLCPIRVGGGTRLKILDALAMERPLISTGIGVEGLGLVDGKHYLKAETPSEFAAAARLLRDDPELGRRMARDGRAFVHAHYSWERIGDQIDRAYAAAALRGDERRAT